MIQDELCDPLLSAHGETSQENCVALPVGGPSISNANLFSRLSFSWIAPLLASGSRKQYINEDEMPELPNWLDPAVCHKRFAGLWLEENKSDMPSMLRVMFRFLGWKYVSLGLLRLFNDICGLLGPFFLGRLLNSYVETKSRPDILWSVLFISSMVLKSFLDSHFTFARTSMLIQIQSSLMSMLFHGQVSLPMYISNKHTVGKMQTLMSIDCERAAGFCFGIHDLWSLVLQLIASLVFLYMNVRWTFLVGLTLVLLMIPLNQHIANTIRKASLGMMDAKDSRTTVTTEMVEGIKEVKSSGWEGFLALRLQKIRDLEVEFLRTIKFQDAICVFMWAITSLLFTAATFSIFALLGYQLRVDSVFPTLALFNILLGPLNSLPWVINGMVESLVSIKRLREFSMHRAPDLGTKEEVNIEPSNGATSLHGEECEFSWSDSNASTRLAIDNLSLQPGSINAVIGDIGSGKTSFLLALLGEMDCLNGQILSLGSATVGYAPQSPYLLDGSIRENIVFGRFFDENRYLKILEACCLRQDVISMAHGDETLVGSETELSCGQCARIGLARALYDVNTRVILIDDVLASLDAKLRKNVALNAIMSLQGQLDKLVVVVTNSPHILNKADQILQVNGNRVSVLSRNGGDESEIYVDHGQVNVATNSLNPEQQNTDILSQARKQGSEGENRITGHVRWGTYLRYLDSQRFWFILTIISLFLMQGSRNFADIWLSVWTSQSKEDEILLRFGDTDDYFLSIYLIVVGACILFTLVRSFAFAQGGIRACQSLYQELLSSMLSWNFSTYLQLPRSRIINRMTSDMTIVDDNLPFIFNIFLAQVFGLVGMLTVILSAQHFNWAMIAVICLLILIYRKIQTFYLGTSRSLRRLESVLRSPIYALFDSVFRGKSVIKSFKAGDYFFEKLNVKLVSYQRSLFASASCSCWLSLRLQLMSTVISSAIVCLSYMDRISAWSPGNISTASKAGLIGLSLSYVLPLTGLLNGFVNSGSELEQEMVSVERVVEYIDLPSQDAESENLVATSLEGDIFFCKVWMRYSSSKPWVLRDIDICIPSGTRFALCGRSGSGKSSLICCLLQLLEYSKGSIYIGLHDLRSMKRKCIIENIGYLSQNPVIFSSNLRLNLDPEGRFSDEELIKVLRGAMLYDQIFSEPVDMQAALASPVQTHNGIRFSSTQCVLLSLCRLLLLRPAYICLDEPSSSMSNDEALRLFEAVDKQIRGCTVIETVHRLSLRAMSADCLAILEEGRVIETGEPRSLLENENSVFYSMLTSEGI